VRQLPATDSSTEFAVVRIIDDRSLERLGLREGMSGHGKNVTLAEPISVCSDNDGAVWVLDRGTEELVRIPPADGREQRTPEIASAHVPLLRSGAVRIDAVNNAYVCEVEDGQIGVFSDRMRLVEWLPAPPYEALELVPGRLVGIAFGPLGDMYLSDEVNGRIYRYDAGGRYLSTFGSEEDPWSQLARPAGLVCASVDGSVYVCDPGQGRVVVFDDAGIPRDIVGDNDLTEPRAVAVDRQGSCYVVDSRERALLVFSSKGDLLQRVEGNQLIPGGLAGPTDIVLVDSTLWIADPPAGRVLEVRLRRAH
jgi:streptogramin lyase